MPVQRRSPPSRGTGPQIVNVHIVHRRTVPAVPTTGGDEMLRLPRRRWRVLASATAAGLVVSVMVSSSPASAAQTIGFPTFSGPAIPQPPVGYNTGSMMQTIYNAESGGTDFWIDRLLARPGSDPSDADGGILMTRGRALFMKTHRPSVL